jgi:hypothetical protein
MQSTHKEHKVEKVRAVLERREPEGMRIVCNHVPRDIINWYDLTTKERKEFDYWDGQCETDAQFFRYKGNVYDLGEFMRIEQPTAPHPQRPGWEKFDGYSSDSFFSGVLVKYVDDCERVICATYFS